MKDLRISPCFVELPVPANVLSAVHGGPMRASARFPKHRSREATASATWTATGAVLAGLAVRCTHGRSTRSIRTLHATGITALDVATESIPTEVDGDSCTPPWKGDGAFEIPEEVLENTGGLDYVVNFESKKVRGCLKGAKQVATLGPASASDEMLERLFLCGVDTFRLNFSHGDHSEKTELIARIRRLEAKYRHPIGILADMQGPKQRCGKFEDENGVELLKGQMFRFDMLEKKGDVTRVQLPHPEILEALTPGKQLLLDDGNIRMEIVARGRLAGEEELPDSDEAKQRKDCTPFVDCKVTVAGRLKANKGVNTPDVILPMSPITDKDKKDIEFACRAGVDWIAMSFVQTKDDMKELRERVQNHGFDEIKLLAKIEKPSAVDDIEGILGECDGVMVARGDLGVEMPPEEVPWVQKQIIRAANDQGKPVIVATQMLESMIKNPTPTRAECSDIANAILDGCDAVMLSGESAVGEYPTQAVAMQRRVIERTQANAVTDQKIMVTDTDDDTQNILATAAALAKGKKVAAIVVFTATGRSAQLLATQRPRVPILAICKCLEVARRVSFIRGVYGTSDKDSQEMVTKVAREPTSVRFSEAVDIACRIAREKGLALAKSSNSDTQDVVVVSRLPLFSQGRLNTIRIVKAEGLQSDGYQTFPPDDED